MALEGWIFWGFVAAFVGWVYAEFRGPRLVRMTLGIAAIILLATFTPTLNQWDVFFYQHCLHLINDKLEVGDVAAVRRAIDLHDEVYQTKGSKAAVNALLRALEVQFPPAREEPRENAAESER